MNIPQLTIQGHGEPLFWLHGMLNSVELDSAYSLINFQELDELVTLYRYNYCDKSVSGNYTWEYLSRELINIVNCQNHQRVILAGLSMGSGTILHAAVNYPEKVKALILVTPPPAWESREKVKAVYRKVAAKTNSNNLPEILKRIVSWSQEPPEYYEEKHPGTRKLIQELRLSFEPAYYTRLYLDGAASDMPSREQIARIHVPTLIIAHHNDENHPLEIAKELNNLIDGSELTVISTYSDYENAQTKMKEFIKQIRSK
ncbi:MAG: alpha/beta hydrolase [Prolixibacteraceae bacterium]